MGANIIISPQSLGNNEEKKKHLRTDHLIHEIEQLIYDMEKVFQVDRDVCTTSIYAAAAAAIGNRFTTIDMKGFINNPSLWLCHVAWTGGGKSPVEDLAMKPLKSRQEEMLKDYQKALAEWEKSGKTAERPVQRKLWTSESTPEALYHLLSQHPMGVTLFREELSGWPKDFGRYHSSGELDNLLSIWSGKSIDVTRLTREDDYVEKPCLNVFGGTQPNQLASVWGKSDFYSSGFLARILWVYPDETLPLKYNAQKVNEINEIGYTNVIHRLIDFPITEGVPFSPKAQELYITFWEAQQRKALSATPEMRATYMKFQIYVEKLAAVNFLLSERNWMENLQLTEIDETSMAVAIESMELFECWASKVYEKMTGGNKIEYRPSKVEAIRILNEAYPIKNKSQFAESLGIDPKLVRRAINEPKDEVFTVEPRTDGIEPPTADEPMKELPGLKVAPVGNVLCPTPEKSPQTKASG